MRFFATTTTTLAAFSLWCLSAAALAQSGEGGSSPQIPIDLNQPVVATVGDIEFRECTLQAEGRDRRVQCAWLTVPEHYDAPEGETLELFIARLPARSPRAKQVSKEPMLFLAGGPGQSASEGYLHIDRAFSGLARERDFYLIDQRGTGHSNRLDCDEALEHAQLFDQQLSRDDIQASISRCLEQLPGDPRFYTTSAAVRDFEQARSALGLPHWNLFGVSYGTRTAQHYMRRHPEAVRTAILDSVVPAEYNLGPNIAQLSQRALDSLYDRCEADQECRERFPDLRQAVESLFARLAEAPLEVRAEDFSSGEVTTVTLTRTHLEVLVRMYLYNTHSVARYRPNSTKAPPGTTSPPWPGRPTALQTKCRALFATGMHNAVICTEDAAFFTPDAEQTARDEQTYMGASFLDNIIASCELWPRGLLDPDFKDPLVSDIPTLLLSGEYDPITPPEYAEQALEHLSNAVHLELKGQGHFVSTAGCAPHLLEKFVNTASPEGLREPCLDRLEAPPLFMNFNGPSP